MKFILIDSFYAISVSVCSPPVIFSADGERVNFIMCCLLGCYKNIVFSVCTKICRWRTRYQNFFGKVVLKFQEGLLKGLITGDELVHVHVCTDFFAEET